MNFPTILTILIFVFVLILNILSWFQPKVLLRILSFARPSDLEKNNFQNELWNLFDSPTYIWFLRLVFLCALIAFCYFFLDYFIL